jgi:uncharacterized protein (DUF302 family)
MKSNQFIIEVASPFDVPVTVQKIVDVAVEKGWQNPATHDLQQSLAKSGKDVRPVQVVEICKPDYSGKMLEGSDERIFSVMMPCRISIYQKEDGKAYVALLDATEMTVGMPESVVSAMTAASTDSYEIVKQAIGL